MPDAFQARLEHAGARLVRPRSELKEAGLAVALGGAGITLEDQVFPKRCGHLEGKQIVPAGEMVAKIEAARSARRDPAFVLCARTGSLQFQSTRSLLTVTVDRLSPAARRRLWRALLPTLADESTFLAARYPLEPAAAASVAMDLQTLNKIDSRPATMLILSTLSDMPLSVLLSKVQ